MESADAEPGAARFSSVLLYGKCRLHHERSYGYRGRSGTPYQAPPPAASGDLTVGRAKQLLVSLLVASLVLSLLVSGTVVLCIIAYFVINIFYSWRLKHVVILDVFDFCGLYAAYSSGHLWAGHSTFRLAFAVWFDADPLSRLCQTPCRASGA